MKIPLSCAECASERIAAGETNPMPPGPVFLADVTDDGIYVAECDKGHTMVSALQHCKYEVLFQSGAVAFHYGFFREAVASASTALERFFEFCCFALWEHCGLERTIADKAWKPLSKRSEQQIGALHALYALVFKTSFPDAFGDHQLNKMTQFRNSVVHAGRIPTREESEAYLRQVYDVVENLSDELRRTCPDAVRKAKTLENSARRLEVAKEYNKSPGDMVYGFFVTSRVNTEADRDFDKRMEFLSEFLWAHVPQPARDSE